MREGGDGLRQVRDARHCPMLTPIWSLTRSISLSFSHRDDHHHLFRCTWMESIYIWHATCIHTHIEDIYACMSLFATLLSQSDMLFDIMLSGSAEWESTFYSYSFLVNKYLNVSTSPFAVYSNIPIHLICAFPRWSDGPIFFFSILLQYLQIVRTIHIERLDRRIDRKYWSLIAF